MISRPRLVVPGQTDVEASCGQAPAATTPSPSSPTSSPTTNSARFAPQETYTSPISAAGPSTSTSPDHALERSAARFRAPTPAGESRCAALPDDSVTLNSVADRTSPWRRSSWWAGGSACGPGRCATGRCWRRGLRRGCSRRRSVRPEDTGIGATPHSRAKDRSERSREALSPAVTSNCPAVSTPRQAGR